VGRHDGLIFLLFCRLDNAAGALIFRNKKAGRLAGNPFRKPERREPFV
jgi:hypothetical protein